MEKNKKIDASVQLLRIIAIFMVIGTHIKLSYVDNEIISVHKMFIACIVGDGVAVFWTILGFYYFIDIEYKKRMKQLFFKIIIPLIVFTLITFYFYRYLSGTHSLLQSMSHTKQEYIDLFKIGILEWSNPVLGGYHFWYLYVYILVVLIEPILEKVKNIIDKSNIDYKKCILFIIALLIFNDLSYNKFFYFNQVTFNGVLGASMFVIMGYILYSNIGKIKNNKKIGMLGLLLFLITNIIRCFIMCKISVGNNPINEPIYWFTSYGALSVIGIIMFVYGILDKFLNKKIVYKGVTHIGKLVFYVYLVHVMVLTFLNSNGVNLSIIEQFENIKYNAILYQIIYTIIIFIISIVISEIILLIEKLIKMLINKIKTQKYK